MINYLASILLYPYPYQQEAFFIGFVILIVFSLVAYVLYKLITWKMGPRIKSTFQSFLVIAGITAVVLFFIETGISLITIHHVNKQLGFSYATPDTPEGELFEIQKVVPGKTMDKAGLKRFDRVQMWNCNHLYILLIDNQGKEVEIPIKRDGEEIIIKVKVPELDIPLARVSFLF